MSVSPVHGTAVAVAVDATGPLLGAMLVGPSGSGKSDLALRLIFDCPWGRTRLVSDDYVRLILQGTQLRAEAPVNIAGLLEVRGLGVTPVPSQHDVILAAAFDLAVKPERMPQERRYTPAGVELCADHAPFLLALASYEASAPARVRVTLKSIAAGHFPPSEQE